MRRSRRSGHNGLEFGGSGEDSFVAVVVTKLTGALLFILLLTMVIMALLPKAVDLPPARSSGAETGDEPQPLAITTPGVLPEAIAGHPYRVALSATGGQGALRWSLDGELPRGLRFDPATGQIQGTPQAGTARPPELVVRVTDGRSRTAQSMTLAVYESDRPLSLPSKWKPSLPPVPWRDWLEHGVGFLLLWLVYLVGMNAVASLQRRALAEAGDGEGAVSVRRRFAVHRLVVRLASLGTAAALVLWLVEQRA